MKMPEPPPTFSAGLSMLSYIFLIASLSFSQFVAITRSAGLSGIDATVREMERAIHAQGPMEPAAERRARSGASEGAGRVIASLAQTASAEPQRTVMQCLGSETLTRACHFQDVFYDLDSARFLHYGAAGASADFFGDDKPGYPWLRLSRCEH